MGMGVSIMIRSFDAWGTESVQKAFLGRKGDACGEASECYLLGFLYSIAIFGGR